MIDRKKVGDMLDKLDAQICELSAKRIALAREAVRRGDVDANESARKIAGRVLNMRRRGNSDAADVYELIQRKSRPDSAPRFIDITRELLSAPVYPDDSGPKLERVRNISDESDFNLSDLSMSAHNGTHIDAPLHFIEDGGDITTIPPEVFCGECVVADITELDGSLPVCERLIVKGGELTGVLADAIAKSGIKLVGVEAQSVGSTEVHRTLLGAGVILLEGLDLSAAPAGYYTVVCQPLLIKGAEGSPCRALLIER